MLFGESLEQALQLAREPDQRVPSAVHGEIVAAGVQQIHFAPELGKRAQHFHFAGEELLVQHRKLHVLLDAMQPAHANAEAVHVAAQDAPHRPAFRARGQHQRGGAAAAVVGQGGVARQRHGIGRRADRPGMLSRRWC